MIRQTGLAQAIDIAENRAKYDECAKKLLSYKAIIAWILKSCTKEFSQYGVQYICDNCLKEEAEVSTYAVHQDEQKSGRHEYGIQLDSGTYNIL